MGGSCLILNSKEEKRYNKYEIVFYSFRFILFTLALTLLHYSNFGLLLCLYLVAFLISSYIIYRKYFRRISSIEFDNGVFKIAFYQLMNANSVIESKEITLEVCHFIVQKNFHKFSILEIEISLDQNRKKKFKISIFDLIQLLHFLKINNGKIIFDYDVRDLLNLALNKTEFESIHDMIKVIKSPTI